jgi:hypothetical protein
MTIFKEGHILKTRLLSERRENQILFNTQEECFVGPFSNFIYLQLPSTCVWQLSHNFFDTSDCPTRCDVVTQDCWAGETGPEAYRTALWSLQTATAGEALFRRNILFASEGENKQDLPVWPLCANFYRKVTVSFPHLIYSRTLGLHPFAHAWNYSRGGNQCKCMTWLKIEWILFTAWKWMQSTHGNSGLWW